VTSLRGEFRAVHAALIYFTRLPLPTLRASTADDWRRAATYFPLVGLVVGSGCGTVLLTAMHAFPPQIAAGLSLVTGALLTGAMHEDGFADVCDGFGGGTTRDRALEIMSDSRMGAFGALGLLLLVGMKWQALALLSPAHAFGVPVAAAALSRAGSISLLSALDYVRADGKARPVVSRLGAPRLALATAFGLVPLFFLRPVCVWALPAILIVRFVAVRWFRRRLGGYTGDCLGAVQQVGEAVCLLVFVALT
jgi:adenosylcobinamide-GDP ribazoletransferase